MAERGRSQLIKPLLAVSSMRSSRPGLHMDSKSKRPIGATQRPLSSLLRVQRKPSTPEDLSVSRARAKLWLLTSVISAVVLLHVLAGVRVSPGSGLASLTSDERQLTIYGEPKPGRTILDNILATYNLLFTNKPVVVEPTTKHTASVIFCHGVTNTAAMWQFAAQELAPYLPHVRWVLPNAPRAPLTMLNGTISYSWFDIAAKGEAAGEWPIPEDEAGMMKAAATIDNLIAAEVRRGVPASRVVVAGFSQGAILTLLVGLTNPRPLAGMISLGGYLPMKQSMHSLIQPYARNVPLFIGHGMRDHVVPYQWANASVSYLEHQLGMTRVTMKTYPELAHWVSAEELQDLLHWLQDILAIK